MADLLDLLKNQVSGQVMETLVSQMGGSKEKTSVVVDTAMSALLNGLSKNVQQPAGATALLGALDRDHDGSILDDLGSLFSGSVKPEQQRAANGAGILKHVLGGKQNNVIEMISKMSGMDANNSGAMLAKMAPVVLGMLGKVKKENGLDASSLVGLIQGSAQKVNKQSKSANLISSLLDKDGDGNVVDDLLEMGGKSLLGKLFGRK